jgi:hypothetical protein
MTFRLYPEPTSWWSFSDYSGTFALVGPAC